MNPKARPAIRFRAGDICPRCLGVLQEDGEGLLCSECGYSVPPEAREDLPAPRGVTAPEEGSPSSGNGAEAGLADLGLAVPTYDIGRAFGEGPGAGASPEKGAPVAGPSRRAEPDAAGVTAAESPAPSAAEGPSAASPQPTSPSQPALEEALARVRELEAELVTLRQVSVRVEALEARLAEREKQIAALKASEDLYMARAEAYRDQLGRKEREIAALKEQLQKADELAPTPSPRRRWPFRR